MQTGWKSKLKDIVLYVTQNIPFKALLLIITEKRSPALLVGVM